MKIIQYQKSYSSKELSKYTYGALFLFIITTIIWIFTKINENNLNLLYQSIFLLTYIVVIYIIFKSLKSGILSKFINNFFGKYGEDIVSDILEKTLDDSYVYIRNYCIPNKGGDIDGILIGPKGVWVVEVKTLSGVFEIIKGIFYKIYKGKLNRYWSPIKQAARHMDFLQSYLKKNLIETKIKALVILAEGKILKIEGSTGIYVIEKEKIHNYFDNLIMGENLEEVQIKKIVNLLKI